MKILIKESQYYVLLEQNNPNILKAYNEIIKGAKYPLGTAKDTILKAFDYIKNSSDFKTLLLMFKDKKTGYGSFEEMINEEYDRFDYDDVIKLQEKLYSIGVILEFRTGQNPTSQLLFFSGGVKITYDTNFKNNKKSIRVNSDCTSKYPPLLKQAQDYWRKWLSSPITKQKFRTNWNVQPKYDTVDGKKVDDIFKEYIDCIDSLKLVFYDNTMVHPPGYEYVDLSDMKNAFAFVDVPPNVYINCSKSEDNKTQLNTVIHEIQHLLYDIKPLNPPIDVRNAFKNSNPKKSIKKMESLSNSFVIDLWSGKHKGDVEYNSKILGLDKGKIVSWLLDYENEQTFTNDPGYVCRETEKASNIQSMRNLFGINPGQNITPEMLKPYINRDKEDRNVHWLLLCWASKGFKDIRLFLADLNKLAFQDTKPTDNTRLV